MKQWLFQNSDTPTSHNLSTGTSYSAKPLNDKSQKLGERGIYGLVVPENLEKRLKKLLILSLFILCPTLAQAIVQAGITPLKGSLDTGFTLTLTQDNSQDTGVPDLRALQKEFLIIGTQRQISYTIINGQAQTAKLWVIALKPRITGILTIPALPFGKESSKPLSVEVTTGSSKPLPPTDNFFQDSIILNTTLDKKSPYIKEEIIYTVKLYNSKRLLDANYQGPKMEDAVIVPLGQSRSYQTLLNNTNYAVEEQQYAIFPQKSGTLNIESPIFTAVVYDLGSEHMKVKNKPLTIQVQPIPQNYKGKDWLPAKALNLNEQYEQPEPTLKQGSTLIRTITLEGVGLPAQLLPGLSLANNTNFQIYTEKGRESNRVRQGELIGKREIKITYLFNKPGSITIPALKLSWFDTTLAKERVAFLPPKTLTIQGTTTASTGHRSPVNLTTTPPVSSNPIPATTSWLGWIVALCLAIIWLLSLVLGYLKKRGTSENKQTYKQALAALQKACNVSDPQKARQALLAWATLHWPKATILNLNDLILLANNTAFKQQLQLLSQALYQQHKNTPWSGLNLLESIKTIIRTQSKKNKSQEGLPPLNP